MRKILITGGAGFIGSALIRSWMKQPEVEVLNIDALTYAGNLQSLESVSHLPNYQFSRTDIRDGAAVERLVDGFRPDVLVHLAAESHVDRSIDNPRLFVETNIVGTLNLLEAFRNLVENNRFETAPRFLHVSTDEVFGTLGPEGLFDEDTAYDPSSPYSASKAGSDHLARAWHRTYGLPILISNCSNNFGPFQFPEKLIPVVIANALAHNTIPIYGDGSNVRDWLFVDDHAEALKTIVARGEVGETYLIGGGNQLNNLDLAKSICQILDEVRPSSHLQTYQDLIQLVTDRPGHDFRYAIDAEKMRTELGWKPQIGFKQGLRQTVEWYLNEGPAWAAAIGAQSSHSQRLGLG